MEIAFDPAKDAINRRKHGISLARAEDFAFDTAAVRLDDREDYGESRFRAIGFIDATLYALAFALDGESVRAISLRKATRYEQFEYSQNR